MCDMCQAEIEVPRIVVSLKSPSPGHHDGVPTIASTCVLPGVVDSVLVVFYGKANLEAHDKAVEDWLRSFRLPYILTPPGTVIDCFVDPTLPRAAISSHASCGALLDRCFGVLDVYDVNERDEAGRPYRVAVFAKSPEGAAEVVQEGGVELAIYPWDVDSCSSGVGKGSSLRKDDAATSGLTFAPSALAPEDVRMQLSQALGCPSVQEIARRSNVRWVAFFEREAQAALSESDEPGLASAVPSGSTFVLVVGMTAPNFTCVGDSKLPPTVVVPWAGGSRTLQVLARPGWAQGLLISNGALAQKPLIPGCLIGRDGSLDTYRTLGGVLPGASPGARIGVTAAHKGWGEMRGVRRGKTHTIYQTTRVAATRYLNEHDMSLGAEQTESRAIGTVDVRDQSFFGPNMFMENLGVDIALLNLPNDTAAMEVHPGVDSGGGPFPGADHAFSPVTKIVSLPTLKASNDVPVYGFGGVSGFRRGVIRSYSVILTTDKTDVVDELRLLVVHPDAGEPYFMQQGDSGALIFRTDNHELVGMLSRTIDWDGCSEKSCGISPACAWTSAGGPASIFARTFKPLM